MFSDTADAVTDVRPRRRNGMWRTRLQRADKRDVAAIATAGLKCVMPDDSLLFACSAEVSLSKKRAFTSDTAAAGATFGLKS